VWGGGGCQVDEESGGGGDAMTRGHRSAGSGPGAIETGGDDPRGTRAGKEGGGVWLAGGAQWQSKGEGGKKIGGAWADPRKREADRA
jgi:hypothetical protein